jgi:hypothetical protein
LELYFFVHAIFNNTKTEARWRTRERGGESKRNVCKNNDEKRVFKNFQKEMMKNERRVLLEENCDIRCCDNNNISSEVKSINKMMMMLILYNNLKKQ